MKNIKKILSLIIVLAILACTFTTTVFAKKNNYELYQKSIVKISAQIQFSASNYDLEFSKSGSGTGWALGVPGKPVQYIATCNHVVDEPEGMYAVYVIPQTGEVLQCVKMEEGVESRTERAFYNGRECVCVIDYFNTKATEIVAIYSGATNDYVKLTVAQTNKDADIAICKIASEPTKKISPLPLQFKDSVTPNTDVVAVGFPGMTEQINAELRLDGSDSTIKDGRIGKKQRTPSMFNEKAMIDTYQLTAETAQGMSGGPVISEETNAVVGIIAFSYIDYSQAKADDYAICVDYLKPLLDAEGIPYKESGKGGVLIWILAIAAVVVCAIVIVVILLLKKEKEKKEAEQRRKDEENRMPIRVEKKHYLIGVSGYMAGKKFGVTTKAVIGRDKSQCNVVYPVDQPGVSGVHCELRLENGVFTLKDCNSSCGTFLENGTKLAPYQAVVLNSGSKFWLGARENTFEVKHV